VGRREVFVVPERNFFISDPKTFSEKKTKSALWVVERYSSSQSETFSFQIRNIFLNVRCSSEQRFEFTPKTSKTPKTAKAKHFVFWHHFKPHDTERMSYEVQAAALCMAAASHNVAVIALLLRECDSGVVNHENNMGVTALMAAIDDPPGNKWAARQPDPACANQIAAVRLLCAHGATLDYHDPRTGMTPLCLASSKGLADIVSILLEHNASVDIAVAECNPLWDGHTALMFAARGDSCSLAKLLIERGADGSKTVENHGARQSLRLEERTLLATFFPSLVCRFLYACCYVFCFVLHYGSMVLFLSTSSGEVEVETALGLALQDAKETGRTALTDLFLTKCCIACGKTTANLKRDAGGVLKKLKRCANCAVRYCSKECQKSDWAQHRAYDCALYRNNL
jgi:hypothetical protein